MPLTVLFDLDGTLIDSRPAGLAAYRLAAACRQNGAERLAGIAEGPLLAMRAHEVARIVVGDNRSCIDEFLQDYDENYRLRTRQMVRVYAGILPMLSKLSSARVPLGIVTNKGGSRAHLDIASLLPDGTGAALFQVIVVADDSVERKPSPVPIQIGIGRGGWDANHCAYVGDGPHDAQAAHAAGCRFIGAEWGYYGRAALLAGGAKKICRDASDLAEVLTDLR